MKTTQRKTGLRVVARKTPVRANASSARRWPWVVGWVIALAMGVGVDRWVGRASNVPATPTVPPEGPVERPPRKEASSRAATAHAESLRRHFLRQAVALNDCPELPVVPTRVPVRLRVGRDGQVKAVLLRPSANLSPGLIGCLRERMGKWEARGINLPGDAEVLLHLDLSGSLTLR